MAISEILDGVWAENTAVMNHSNATTNVHGAGVNSIEQTGNKNAANGYAGLDASGILPGVEYLLYKGAANGYIPFDNVLGIAHLYPKIASANVRNSSDAEMYFYPHQTGIQKSITFYGGLHGSIRISFDMWNNYSLDPAWTYGQIYKNGVAIGTFQELTAENSWTTFTEDFTIVIKPGDIIQLWGQNVNGVGKFRNFRIEYDNDANYDITCRTDQTDTLGSGDQYIKHSLATAVSDFLVASGSGAFVKKTLAETLTLLGAAGGFFRQFWQKQGTVVAGTWAWAADGSQTNYASVTAEGAGLYQNSATHANSDEYKWSNVYLAAGNYKITVVFHKNTMYGIAEFLFGNTSLGTVDQYAASGQYNQISTISFTLSNSAIADFRLRANGKNASSTNYFIAFSRLELEKTG